MNQAGMLADEGFRDGINNLLQQKPKFTKEHQT
ncbi:MAG: hypothetical protein CM15mV63_410 [uncultured marine virus]|nr:MAG: hypothetical protein CM15mV63_410 [uncultured marine virus]